MNSFDSTTVLAFFSGVLVGAICMAGLFFGVKALFKSKEEGLDPWESKRLAWRGSFILIGQFIAAGGLLYVLPFLSTHPIAVAMGLFSLNMGIPIYIVFAKGPVKKP